MYESHFSMTSRPFRAAPDVARYFPAATIEQARKRLAHGVEHTEAPAIVIGPPGTGKTLLLEVLAQSFGRRFDVVLLAGSQLCTRRALLQMILHDLDLPYKDLGEGELRLSLIDRLQSPDDSGEGLLLLVDEAQAMPTKLVEELRMLMNLVRDGRPRVRTIFAGTPQFEERLGGPSLESISQRIATRCYLLPFDCAETRQYVIAQLSASGVVDNQIFDEDALTAIYHATDGAPRLINQLADHALLLAAADGERHAPVGRIEEAWANLQQLPMPSEITASSYDSSESCVEFGGFDDEEAAAHGGDQDEESEELELELVETDADISLEFESPVPPKSTSRAKVEESPPREVAAHNDPIEQIASIQRDISSVEQQPLPVSKSAKVDPFSADPFGDAFEDEVIVVNQQVSTEQVCMDWSRFQFESEPTKDSTPIPSVTAGSASRAEKEEPSRKLKPTPLFIQPPIDELDDDPVYPENENGSVDGAAPFAIVMEHVDDCDDDCDDDCGDALSEKNGARPTVASTTSSAPRLTQLFSSLRRN